MVSLSDQTGLSSDTFIDDLLCLTQIKGKL